jgi:hypothetical protein
VVGLVKKALGEGANCHLVKLFVGSGGQAERRVKRKGEGGSAKSKKLREVGQAVH